MSRARRSIYLNQEQFMETETQLSLVQGGKHVNIGTV